MPEAEDNDPRPKLDEKIVPEVVKEEPDDKPAASNLRWTIIIAVAVLVAIYLIFFIDRG